MGLGGYIPANAPLLSPKGSSLNNGPAVKDNFADAPPTPASIMGPLLRGIRGSWAVYIGKWVCSISAWFQLGLLLFYVASDNLGSRSHTLFFLLHLPSAATRFTRR